MRRSVVLLSTLLMILSVTFVASVFAADSLSVVSVTQKKVQLSATMGIEQVRYFTLDSPKRLVVDLYGVRPGSHAAEFALSDGFQSLRVGILDNKTRFVFDVAENVFPTFKVDTGGDQVTVTWQNSQDVVANASAEPAPAGSAKITTIDFTPVNGKSNVSIGVSGNAEMTEPLRNGNKVQFSLKNTTLPRALRREFDTFAFPTAIYSMTPYLVNESGQPEVRFNVVLKGDAPYSFYKDASGYVFSVTDGDFANATPAITGTMPVASSELQQPVSSTPASSVGYTKGQLPVPVIEQIGSTKGKYSGEKTSLVFDNADVRDILRLIAEISDLNIIASDEVKGNVTLRLIDVPWDQALDLILDVTGLGMVQEGNVVRVLPKEKIRSMKEAELTAVRSQEKLEPLVTEVVTVSYADLASVAGPVKDVLSDRGTVTPDSRNKLLILSDVPTRIEKAKELIEILDTPERQVMIEARIVQVNSKYARDLGVNWGISGSDSDGPLDPASFDSLTGAGGGFLVGVADNPVGSFTATPGFGTQMKIGRTLIDNVILDLQLSALESNGEGKVISTPRVTTLNGEEATISQGTTIPYQTSGSDGPKTEFVDAELKLEVTPVINPDGSIILEVLATNDSPSLTAGATAPSIDTKKAETKVLVHDGETTVIGGIYIENIAESSDGVPGLMDIPVLGHLFKSQKKSIVKDELLIFITPRIVHEN